MSPTLKSTKFGEEGVDRCKPNFNMLCEETRWIVICKRNRVDIFCRLCTMHERDRHTYRPRNGNIDTNRQNHFRRCRLKGTEATCNYNENNTVTGADSYCSPVNECKYNRGGCSQVCVDTDDSYYCTCHEGYQPAPTSYTCPGESC